MFLSLAWRNIWRNRRRTAVILCAIVIGVWSNIVLGALMRGMTEQMVASGIATLTGDLQVHAKGFRDDPVIENSMTGPAAPEAAMQKLLPPGAHWASRVRVNAVAGNARHTSGVTMVGIDPAAEAKVSFIGQAVTQGRYLKPDEKYGIVVGHALLKKYETRLGHKLILMSQDTTKQIASRAFKIVGVFRAEMEATEKQYVFVSKQAAQKMLKLGGSISEISALLPDERDLDRVTTAIRAALPEKYQVDSWPQLLPLLTAYVSMLDGFIAIWYVVVFVAMGFGIVNTTLMAVFERIREFGLFKSLGMRPGWIIREVLTESFFMLLIGMAIGNALGLVSVWLLKGSGINLSALAAGAEFFGMPRMLYPDLQAWDLLMANLVVFFLGLVVSLYPAVKAARFTPVEALAHT